MPEMLALAPGVEVVVPSDGANLRYSQAEVDLTLGFFKLLVFGQNEWAGKPFRLLDWQEQVVREFFGVQVEDVDGTWVRYRRYLYEETPKKNGKTEFAAGLGLKFLVADREPLPLVGVFSTDKVNADQIYRCAKFMVENTALGQPEHDPLTWCVDSKREIHCKLGGMMKVYSSDAAQKHGESYSAIILDELHAQQNRKLWDILTTGSDAARRQQAVVVLTTAGDDPDHKNIGWEVHEKCRRILACRRGEPERELDVDNPQWLPIMYGLSTLTGDDPDKLAEIDIYDEALWKLCNPSYGVTINPRKFRADALAAKESEAAERNFRWLRLNQWTSSKSAGWVPVTLYDKTQWGPSKKEDREAWVAERLAGKRCYGGLDLSKSTDLTAFVLIFPPQDGLEVWVALFFAWRPRDGVLEAEQRDHVPYRDWERAGFLRLCDGDIIDYSDVESTILTAAKKYDLRSVGTDPFLSRTLSQRLIDGGVDVIEIPQTMMGMSPATKELERMIRNHEMLHVHNTCARWCFGNARVVTDGNENVKLMKNRSVGRIDITVAWVIALATAMAMQFQPGDLGRALEAGEFTL